MRHFYQKSKKAKNRTLTGENHDRSGGAGQSDERHKEQGSQAGKVVEELRREVLEIIYSFDFSSVDFENWQIMRKERKIWSGKSEGPWFIGSEQQELVKDRDKS